MPENPYPVNNIIDREFSKCDPRVTQAIKEVFCAFKRMAGGMMHEKDVLATAVKVCAGFEFNLKEKSRRRGPINIGGF